MREERGSGERCAPAKSHHLELEVHVVYAQEGERVHAFAEEELLDLAVEGGGEVRENLLHVVHRVMRVVCAECGAEHGAARSEHGAWTRGGESNACDTSHACEQESNACAYEPRMRAVQK